MQDQQEEPGTSCPQNEEEVAAEPKTSPMPLQNLQLQIQQQPADILASEEPANISAFQLLMQPMQQQMQKMQEMHQLQLQTPRVLGQESVQELPQQPPQETTPLQNATKTPHKQKGPAVGGSRQNANNSNRKYTCNWCYYLCIH